MSSPFAGPARGGGEALAAALPAGGAAVPRAGAASAGCGDLLLPLLGLCSLLYRGRWGCAAIAPGKEPASPPSPSPGGRRSALVSQRAPSRVTVRGKLRPVPPSSPSPQAGADTRHGRPPPRCLRQGLGWGRKARSGSLKTLCTGSPSLPLPFWERDAFSRGKV